MLSSGQRTVPPGECRWFVGIKSDVLVTNSIAEGERIEQYDAPLSGGVAVAADEVTLSLLCF